MCDSSNSNGICMTRYYLNVTQKRGNTESGHSYWLIAHFPRVSRSFVYYDTRTRFCRSSNFFRSVRFKVNFDDMTVTKNVFDERIQVKIRSCQIMELILTGVVVLLENIRPSVLLDRPRKVGLYSNDVGLYIFL